MSRQEVLEKVIKKAIDNGWNVELLSDGWVQLTPTIKHNLNFKSNNEGIIFNHDFAKALWGYKPEFEVNLEDVPAWQYHLQQMVIADDPIEYLKDNLDKEGRE